MRRKRWRILQPNEVGRVLNAFTDEQARAMFLTLMLTGVRRFELLGLRWRDVSLIENTIRVRESRDVAAYIRETQERQPKPFATTKGYLHLAGVVFRDEADALERRLLTSAY